MFAVAALLYDGPWVAERYAAIRPVMETRPEILHPTTRAVIGAAGRYSAADAFAGLYSLAELRRAADAVWERVDVLAVPTYPRPQTRAAVAADPIGPNSELGTYTNFVNLLDWCALAVPGRARRRRLSRRDHPARPPRVGRAARGPRRAPACGLRRPDRREPDARAGGGAGLRPGRRPARSSWRSSARICRACP